MCENKFTEDIYYKFVDITNILSKGIFLSMDKDAVEKGKPIWENIYHVWFTIRKWFLGLLTSASISNDFI